jgi:hypothetical protein
MASQRNSIALVCLKAISILTVYLLLLGEKPNIARWMAIDWPRAGANPDETPRTSAVSFFGQPEARDGNPI